MERAGHYPLPGATRQAGGPQVIRRALALAVVALCVVFAAPQARAASITDHDTWGQVAEQLDTDLADAVAQYQAGNNAGAAAAVGRALNTDYVASNLARVIDENLDPALQQEHTDALTSLQRQAFKTDQLTALQTGIADVSASVRSAAEQLDGIADLASPRDYAAALTAQTQQERAELDAQKKNSSQGRGDSTWSQVAAEMVALLDQSIDAAASGDGRGGADLVNKAYYSYYEKLGFERTVMSAISGQRVSEVENQFKTCRKAMVGGASLEEVTAQVESLKTMLTEDATALDGGAADRVSPLRSFATSAFGQAFIILLREGLEAILVVAAIIAYLVKAGNRDKVRYIYLGAVGGLAASAVMWVVFNVVMDAAGAQQETLEGVTALIAMVMLAFTSNWMLSKSSVTAWNRYISDKTAASLTGGSVGALAGLAFLAVFREGAETVMFYQALFAMVAGDSAGVWGGFAAATAVLVVVFLLIRFTSVRIPIRPFFTITSALMAVLVVVFAGGGIHAFIEGDVIDGTYLPGMPTLDVLGVYPYVETLAAQAVALLVVVVLAGVSIGKQRRTARALPDGPAATAALPADLPTSGDSPDLPHTTARTAP